MEIKQIKTNKKQFLHLLLIGDEQEDMIDKYLEKSKMFVLYDNGEEIGVCVVTDEDNGVLEIKNIAINPKYQKMGYGKAMINFIEENFKNGFSVLQLGTGDSPLTIPFYEKCGFKRFKVIKNFFVDNYKNPIFEMGVQLVDMIYLKKDLN